jgi:aryl-alcohol dehydrogenase-like predicted oxidoreductase
MQHRKLGNTGPHVSALGLGAVGMSGMYGPEQHTWHAIGREFSHALLAAVVNKPGVELTRIARESWAGPRSTRA